MGNTYSSVVPLQHLLVPVIMTALLIVSRSKYNVDVCLVMLPKLVIAS